MDFVSRKVGLVLLYIWIFIRQHLLVYYTLAVNIITWKIVSMYSSCLYRLWLFENAGSSYTITIIRYIVHAIIDNP